ncbi:hypothetical protein EBR57_07320, partial [bacterium]|nr:hypothetical protein [bacterium]
HLTASPILYFEGILTDQGATSGNAKVYLQGLRRVNITINTSANLSGGRRSTLGTELWRESFTYEFHNGNIYVELGRINPIPVEIFSNPDLSFVIGVEGIAGEVGVPILSVPLAARSEVSERALSVEGSGVIGTIGSDALRGVYSGITGLGEISITLNASGGLKVGRLMVVDPQGMKVGIGVTDPREMLEVGGSVKLREGALIFPDGSTMNTAARDIRLAKGILSTSDVYIEGDSGRTGIGNVGIRLGGVERLTILRDQTSGLVGIGVTNPTQELDINGGIKLRTTNRRSAGTIRYESGHFEGYNGSTWVRLDAAANADSFWSYDPESGMTTFWRGEPKIGLGVSNPSYPLDVAGTIRSDVFKGSFEGDGSRITSVNPSAISGSIPFSRGGTGLTSAPTNSVMYYSPTRNGLTPLSLGSGQVMYGVSGGLPVGGSIMSGTGIAITTSDSGITVSHEKTSGQTSFGLTGGEVIQSVNLDEFGHVVGLASVGLDQRYIQLGELDTTIITRRGGQVEGTIAMMPSSSITTSRNGHVVIMPNGTGKVGIGTEIPQQKLDINGALRVGDTAVGVPGSIRYSGTSGRFEGYNNEGNWVPLDIQSDTAGGWTTRASMIYALNNTYKVGIGNYAPEEMLHVSGRGYFTQGIRSSGNVTLGSGVGVMMGNTAIRDGVMEGNWRVSGDSLSARRVVIGDGSGTQALVVGGAMRVSDSVQVGNGVMITSSGVVSGNVAFTNEVTMGRVNAVSGLQLNPSGSVGISSGLMVSGNRVSGQN